MKFDFRAPIPSRRRPAPRDGSRSIPIICASSIRQQDKEEAKFWFCDSQHWPSPFKPFDTVTVEFAVKCLGQYNTRHYLVPPANGIDYRILNGYVYMSPVAVAPEKIGDRVPAFHAARRLLFPELELADRELAQEGVGRRSRSWRR